MAATYEIHSEDTWDAEEHRYVSTLTVVENVTEVHVIEDPDAVVFCGDGGFDLPLAIVPMDEVQRILRRR